MRHFLTCFALASALLAPCAASSAWAQHETAQDLLDGERAYRDRGCANCHGPNGDLIPGINFSAGQFRRPMTDAELSRIIRQGIPNTPMPPNPTMRRDEASRVVEYLRSMSEGRETKTDGDARRGRTLFEGKGECRDCHAVSGEGSRVGPDLSDIGAIRGAGSLQRSLLDPTSQMMPINRPVRVVMRDGTVITGRRLNEDTYTLQLIDDRERLRSLTKGDLREYTVLTTSPMPSYKDLTADELADLIAYLLSLRG